VARFHNARSATLSLPESAKQSQGIWAGQCLLQSFCEKAFKRGSNCKVRNCIHNSLDNPFIYENLNLLQILPVPKHQCWGLHKLAVSIKKQQGQKTKPSDAVGGGQWCKVGEDHGFHLHELLQLQVCRVCCLILPNQIHHSNLAASPAQLFSRSQRAVLASLQFCEQHQMSMFQNEL